MIYPWVSVSDIREEFPKIDTSVCSDTYVTNAINRGANIAGEKMFWRCNFGAIQALTTPPQVVWDIIFYIACAFVLRKSFSEFQNADANDIKLYLDSASDVIKELESGKRKIVDIVTGTVYAFGVYYQSILTNQNYGSNDRQDGRPYFGMGDLGQSLQDSGDRSYYPMLYDKH